MSEGDVAISVSGLSKIYKIYASNTGRLKEALDPRRKTYHQNFPALKDVSFEIFQGETVGIVGRNGSGKSTLLKVLAGVLSATSGKVEVTGDVSALLELGAGFNQEHTGLDNIYLAGALRGLSRKIVQQRMQSIIDFADIGQFLYQKVKTYSSGMYSRLAFAVAINVDPDILIIDEALSVGDAAFRRKCYAKMEELRKQGKTILLVSHSESSIIEMCNRAILIDGGEKISEGKPKQVIADYLKLINASGDSYHDLRSVLKNGTGETERQLGSDSGVAQYTDDGEMFNPGLVSKSKVEYKSNGAVLSGARIETLDGRRVNRLVHGRRYKYLYEVSFAETARDVSFGMMIKTLQGVNLCGGSYPVRGELIRKVEAGSQYAVAWEFDCLLEEGVYFTNCGVRAQVDGEVVFMHRILDVLIFQVAPRVNRITTASINMALSASVAKEIKK